MNILHDLSIKAKPSKVFDAVSTPSELNNWWTLESSGQPNINEFYRLYFAPEYDWKAQVTICNYGQHFELKMVDSDEDWNPTRFGFELEPKEDGTLLKFYHKGWESTNHHYRRTSYCWAILLNHLKKYIEKGLILPYEERNQS